MQEMRPKFLNYFKNVCLETAKLSTCVSKQVGAILVKDNRIIAIGYNGVAKGEKHCNEIFSETFNREEHSAWSKFHEYHAEENLLLFCLREGISTKGCSLFVSLSPCINCAKLVTNSGIEKVYYIEEYDRDKTGLAFLEDRNISTVQI